MNTTQSHTDHAQNAQHKIGVAACALFALVLVASIVHDLGASPAVQARVTPSIHRAA